MNPEHQQSGVASTSARTGVAFGLDCLRAPVFPLRLAAPDASGGGSGPGFRPKGVPLPGLLAARQQHGLSQAELAARSGISEKTISRLEHGGRAHYVTLERLRKTLRVSRQRLLRPLP